ncbi:unnamed protein product [Ambrosiozyma monospora]|uniref:Unnamed protein product n=1 Tax=Ambrosiozyma monospora TaxID=43982 RepID=A0ACB5T8J6_AMBMO|nr:unnamed protein product [Ambrosiozyma monospora]
MSDGKKVTKIKRVIPRLKPVPYTLHDLNSTLKPPHRSKQTTIKDIEFYSSEEHPFNRRGFKYKSCRPNPYFSSTMYSTSDLPPFQARFSYFDRSTAILTDESCSTATSLQGWRSSRTSFGVREGKWYVEFKLIKANDGESNVRFGFARREANLEAPVGFDGYGYGFRDKLGQRVHLSRPAEFLTDGEEFNTGDVIGLLIELPPLDEQQKIARLQIEQESLSNPAIQKPQKSLSDVLSSIKRGHTEIKVTDFRKGYC